LPARTSQVKRGPRLDGLLADAANAKDYRLAGYDYVISIEHEDAFALLDERLMGAMDILKRAILRDPPVEAWWT